MIVLRRDIVNRTIDYAFKDLIVIGIVMNKGDCRFHIHNLCYRAYFLHCLFHFQVFVLYLLLDLFR
jgi:hypothetical protein